VAHDTTYKYISCCERCPFVTGMGSSDIAPSFVRCVLDKDQRLVPEPPTTYGNYGDPPPTWCPLRRKDQTIRVALRGAR
jgi:hypothetical protein